MAKRDAGKDLQLALSAGFVEFRPPPPLPVKFECLPDLDKGTKADVTRIWEDYLHRLEGKDPERYLDVARGQQDLDSLAKSLGMDRWDLYEINRSTGHFWFVPGLMMTWLAWADNRAGAALLASHPVASAAAPAAPKAPALPDNSADLYKASKPLQKSVDAIYHAIDPPSGMTRAGVHERLNGLHCVAITGKGRDYWERKFRGDIPKGESHWYCQEYRHLLTRYNSLDFLIGRIPPGPEVTLDHVSRLIAKSVSDGERAATQQIEVWRGR